MHFHVAPRRMYPHVIGKIRAILKSSQSSTGDFLDSKRDTLPPSSRRRPENWAFICASRPTGNRGSQVQHIMVEKLSSRARLMSGSVESLHLDRFPSDRLRQFLTSA